MDMDGADFIEINHSPEGFAIFNGGRSYCAQYMIPLQLFVLSRFPDVLGRASGRGNEVWVLAIVLYCALIQLVWLFYADHAHAWLPYQFYLWVWYWQ